MFSRCPFLITGLVASKARKFNGQGVLGEFAVLGKHAVTGISIDFEDVCSYIANVSIKLDCGFGSPGHMALDTFDLRQAVNILCVFGADIIMAISAADLDGGFACFMRVMTVHTFDIPGVR